jgi:CSLREA domain-containing protein
MFSPLIKFVLLAAIFLVSLSAARAATFSVNTTADTQDALAGNGVCADTNGQCSFRAAISEANAFAGNDTINLPSGQYTQTLVSVDEDQNAGGDWDIRSNITINGTGSGTTVLQAAATVGTATERVLDVRSGTVVLNKLTARNGRYIGVGGAFTNAGAGIQNLGTLTLNFVVVRDNRENRDSSGGSFSGGIFNNGPAITINDSTITSNQCNNPTGPCRGGGFYSYATGTTITVSNSSFTNNQANYTGGLSGGGFGAGFGAGNSDTTINITGSTFANNTTTGRSGWGVGFEISFPTGSWNVNVSKSIFSNNQALTAGGGSGAGIAVFGYLSTINLIFDRISVDGNNGNGGAGAGLELTVDRAPLTATITNSSISNNTGATFGGGLLVGNSGTDPASAITVNLTNTTVSGNSATNSGGGLHATRSGSGNPAFVNLNFCTFTNNTTDSDNDGTGDGGGISANVATNEATINLKNSIVANNADPGGQAPDIFRTMISGGYNHIKNTTGGIFAAGTGDVAGMDPTLTALALNGGVTLNRLPDTGSPVKDTIPAGTNGCGNVISTDQRGVARPANGSCDKGATERGLIIVTNEVLPYGSINDPYAPPIVADYGQPTYTYTVVGGSVPDGMSLNPDGTWSGVPTQTKLYSFTVMATDSQTVAFGTGRSAARAMLANTAQKTFQLRILGPTASDVTVSGRVSDSTGRGIRNVNVSLTDQQGHVQSALTGPFGYYQLTSITSGQTCVVLVAAKRFSFSEPLRVISVNTELSGLDFVADP